MKRLSHALLRMKLGISSNGTCVTLKWISNVGGVVDPTTGSIQGGVNTRQCLTVKALVHYAEAKSVLRQNVEIEVGDAILDFPADVDLTGKPDLKFEFDGGVWVQKEVSEKLAKAWDASISGKQAIQTVVCKRAT